MEDLTRMVAESMARHGIDTPVDHRRLQWSRWFACESALDLHLVPNDPGLFAVAEEIVAPGDIVGGSRMLAVLQLAHTEDLAISMTRLFAPLSPLAERAAVGRLFARFTVVHDDTQRRSAHAAFQRWLANSTEAASGIGSDSTEIAAFPSASAQIDSDGSTTDEPNVTPLPSGF